MYYACLIQENSGEKLNFEFVMWWYRDGQQLLFSLSHVFPPLSRHFFSFISHICVCQCSAHYHILGGRNNSVVGTNLIDASIFSGLLLAGDIYQPKFPATSPYIVDVTQQKRRREERSYVVTDGVLVSDRSKTEYENVLDPRQQQVNIFDFPYGILIINLQSRGFETPGTLTNFVEIGQAHDKILSLKLDQVLSLLGLTLLYFTILQISRTTRSFSTNGTSISVDPKGYLASLDNVILKSDMEIGIIERARMLFNSLVKSNPKHAPGWIAAACLEGHAGRMVAARKIIKQCCKQCPKSEDVWLEAARLNISLALFFLSRIVTYYPHRTTTMQKLSSPTPFNILDKASRSGLQLPSSSKTLWLKNACYEKPSNTSPTPPACGKKPSTSSPQHLVPGSSSLRAVEIIPLSMQLWLALARLESTNIFTTISKFPKFPKLYMVQGQIHQQQSNNTAARISFAAGIKSCPNYPHQPTRKGKREEHQSLCIALQSTSSQHGERPPLGQSHQGGGVIRGQVRTSQSYSFMWAAGVPLLGPDIVNGGVGETMGVEENERDGRAEEDQG